MRNVYHRLVRKSPHHTPTHFYLEIWLSPSNEGEYFFSPCVWADLWYILTWHIVKVMSCNFQGWILREPQGLSLHLGMVHLGTYISLSEKAQASTQRGWHVRELKPLPVQLSSWSAASTNIQLNELVHVQTSRYPLL